MQAIIMIHGMGEQIPMATLNNFVDTVWTKDRNLTNNGKPNPNTGKPRNADDPEDNVSWAKPDMSSQNFELRRITTETSKGNQRVDFFEFYWAHHIEGTTPGQLLSWIASLLLRNPRHQVPKNLRSTWYLLWILTLLVLFCVAYPTIDKLACLDFPEWLRYGLVGFGAVTWFIISRFLVKSFGDVARYVKAKPYNVHIRQKIRKDGVALLESILDEKDDTGKYVYDNISVVSHSLGTIVAYDILTHAFAKRNTQYGEASTLKPEPNRAKLEKLVRDASDTSPLEITAFQELQDAARLELNTNGTRWAVRDFITLGSPLTHAEFLLAKDKAQLEHLKSKRVFPTCPPILEFDQSTNALHFTYRYGGVTAAFANENGKSSNQKKALKTASDTPRTPHHAALFAYTRWTNIYSPQKYIVFGDLISGKLRDAFGITRNDGRQLQGIKDIPVMPKEEGGRGPLLTHTKYWKLNVRNKKGDNVTVPHHIKKLRQALRIDT